MDSPVGGVFTFRGSNTATTIGLTAMELLLVLSISVVKMAMKQSTHLYYCKFHMNITISHRDSVDNKWWNYCIPPS